MTNNDPFFDRLMMLVVGLGVLIVALAVYAIATRPDVIEVGQGPTEIEVVLNEFVVSPERFDVTPGQTYEFIVHNEGAFEHEFRLTTGTAVDAHIEAGHADHDHDESAETDDILMIVDPGETAVVTVTFDGTTSFDVVACLLPGHYEAGMFSPLVGLPEVAADAHDDHDDDHAHEGEATEDHAHEGEATEDHADETDHADEMDHADDADHSGATDHTDGTSHEDAVDPEPASAGDGSEAGQDDATSSQGEGDTDVTSDEADAGHPDDGHSH